MAKVLNKLAVFVSGNPEADEPAKAFFTYEVVDGAAVKRNQTHSIANPDFTKSANQFWADGVAEIEAKEGI